MSLIFFKKTIQKASRGTLYTGKCTNIPNITNCPQTSATFMTTHPESQQMSRGVFNRKGCSATGIGLGVTLVGTLSAGAGIFAFGDCAKSTARCLHLRKDTSESCDSHTIELDNDTTAAKPPTGSDSVVVLFPSAARLSEVADGLEQCFSNDVDPEPGLDTNTASISDHSDPDDVNAFWFSCAPPFYQEVFEPPPGYRSIQNAVLVLTDRLLVNLHHDSINRHQSARTVSEPSRLL